MSNVLMNFHTNFMEKIKKNSQRLLKMKLKRTQMNVFFSKMTKNVLNVRYIYVL